MRVYRVQPGDTPADIAARDEMAGCPKCAIDLIHANPHKPTVMHPNGYQTFRELRVGENLNIPDKWFSKEFDELPRAYFAALPHPDGVTSSTLGDSAAGVLGDYAALDMASTKVNELPQMDLSSFGLNADIACGLIDNAIKEVGPNAPGAGNAQDAKAAVTWVLASNTKLLNALQAGDEATASATRSGMQSVLATALSSARKALNEFYGEPAHPVPPPPPPPAPTPSPSSTGGFSAPVISTARALAESLAANPNYCSDVSKTGTEVNTVIHAFKKAWNESQSQKVPINTGNYEQATADAVWKVLGTAPVACSSKSDPAAPPPPFEDSDLTAPEEKKTSLGTILGVGLLGAGAVAGALYLATRGEESPPPARRPGRVRPRRAPSRPEPSPRLHRVYPRPKFSPSRGVR